jgi:hypothetical protein
VSQPFHGPVVVLTRVEEEALAALARKQPGLLPRTLEVKLDRAMSSDPRWREQLWKTLGHDSFEAWLADPVIDLSRSWVFTLVSVYRELVVLQNVPEESLRGLNPSKLQDVLPVVRKRALPVGNVLADVESLSRGDLRERYRSGGTGTTQSANGSVPDDSTHYDAEREPQFVRCPVCQSRVREDQIRGRDAS